VVRRRIHTAKAKPRGNLAQTRRNTVAVVVFTDEIENLLLAAGERFHAEPKLLFR
jgi:hypothetical protein